LGSEDPGRGKPMQKFSPTKPQREKKAAKGVTGDRFDMMDQEEEIPFPKTSSMGSLGGLWTEKNHVV